MSGKGPRTLGPWTVHAERVAFENPWISVVDHQVTHPDGSAGEYGVVRFKHRAIGALPIDEDGSVWLVGQHRFPLDDYTWELPEGGGALGEAPLDAAKRELREETGLFAREWIELCEFDVSNSVSDEVSVCYLAAGLEAGEAAPDGSESLNLRRIFFNELLHEVLTGRIRDSLTIVMTLMAYVRALRGELPEPMSKVLLR